MSTPCEEIARKVLPALRALIARELVRRHGLAQSKVASLLGVTQASVSHYLSFKRGKLPGDICDPDMVEAMAKEIADGIARGSMGPEELPRALCRICLHIKHRMGRG